MLSLWSLGIQNELFPLIHQMNKQSLISIRTPYGTSSQFSCPSIVKQGAVLSTNLCGSSTGQLISELDVTDECGATIGGALIKGVMFVDDSTTVNRNPNGSIKSNHTVSSFSRKRRLGLNIPKCVQLPVNLNKSEIPPLLLLDNEEVATVTSSKCLGDIFASNGANNELILDRVGKGKSIIISALSLCNDITLGQHYVKSAVTFYKCVFLQCVLFNSEAWSNITQTHIKELRRVQLKFLKRIMQAPNATPNCFTFLEFGLLPIDYEIHKRQLMFLQHILKLPPSAPVFQLYQQQVLFAHEHNWPNTMKQLLVIYNLQHADAQNKSKNDWKLLVNTAVTNVAFKSLTTICRNKAKTSHLQYDTFTPQPYLATCPTDVSAFLFRLRSRSLNCKDNHHESYPNLICRKCNVEIERQQHIINCRSIFPNVSHLLLDELLLSNLEPNMVFVRRIMDRYLKFHEGKCNQQPPPLPLK